MKNYVTIDVTVFKGFMTNYVMVGMSGLSKHIIEYLPHFLFIRELNINQKQEIGFDTLFGFNLLR